MKYPVERLNRLADQSADVVLDVDQETFDAHVDIIKIEREITEVRVAANCCRIINDIVREHLESGSSKNDLIGDMLGVVEMLSDKYVR